ncbi:hypothetical protein PSCICN_14150 [Pseudomonas cichorii]|nr:hypothetical protein PSCICN_14150 [Pseudomonas cichorii]
MKLFSRFAFLLQRSRTEWEFGELLLEARQCVELPANPGTRYSDRFSRPGSEPLCTAFDLLGKLRVEDGKHAGTIRPTSLSIAMLRDAVSKPDSIAPIEPRIIPTVVSMETPIGVLEGCSPLSALAQKSRVSPRARTTFHSTDGPINIYHRHIQRVGDPQCIVSGKR